jgi:hypothetical protein
MQGWYRALPALPHAPLHFDFSHRKKHFPFSPPTAPPPLPAVFVFLAAGAVFFFLFFIEVLLCLLSLFPPIFWNPC